MLCTKENFNIVNAYSIKKIKEKHRKPNFFRQYFKKPKIDLLQKKKDLIRVIEITTDWFQMFDTLLARQHFLSYVAYPESNK